MNQKLLQINWLPHRSSIKYIYEDIQETIKRVLAYRITSQAIPLNVLITALHKLCLGKTFEMVDTRSKMQLAELNSKPHGVKVSGISQTAQLDYASIFLHGQSTTNPYTLTSFMNPITSIITTGRIMRQNLRSFV